jgi:hypothetical protein
LLLLWYSGSHRAFELDVDPDDVLYECVSQRKRRYRIMPHLRAKMVLLDVYFTVAFVR